MAIATTTLFNEIHGSAGSVDFRTRRNGKIEIGKKRIPSNPQSTEQQNTRNAYGRLHELWQNAAWIDKTQYENIATAYDISAWNAFIMRHLPIMRLNPVAYWPFVENTGTILHDFTTNYNHGTIHGATWETSGKYDIPRLYFDGIDDFVDCHNDPSLNITNTITIIAGIQTKNMPPGHSIWRGIIMKGDYLIGQPYHISFQTVNALYFGVSVLPTTVNFPFLEDDVWHLIEGTYNGSQLNIYMDNILKNSAPAVGLINTTAESLWIGAQPSLDRYFKGPITEAHIHSPSLTLTQSTSLYNSIKKFYVI